jgi:hypothetical protein
MSSQTEWAVRKAPSNQPAIVWRKRSLATQCANPQCPKELLYLREGTLGVQWAKSHSESGFMPPGMVSYLFVFGLVTLAFWWWQRKNENPHATK